MKTCCFTGHRNITEEQKRYATDYIIKYIDNLIWQGYTHFITGMADGADLLVAKVVLDFKSIDKEIFLEAAVPYRDRLKCKSIKFINILKYCDKVTVIQEKYDMSCFMKRNKYMVDNSDVVIAIWDGRKMGGTYNTIKYAESQRKKVLLVIV